MKRNISAYIEKNWDDLRQQIQSQWMKLSENDLDEIAKSPKQLIEKLKIAYNRTADEIDEEITAFLSKYSLGDGVANDIETQAASIQNMLCKYADQTYRYIKDRSIDMEKSTEKHIKSNPMRSMGIALIGGILLAKMIF